jgi:hypothetical protein
MGGEKRVERGSTYRFGFRMTESISLTITRLRRDIQDALWDGDAERAAALSRELARLEMLQSYGETWDHDY